MQDVLDLAPQQLVPQALKAIKSRRAAGRITSADPYIEQECAAIQEHENEQAEVVIVCEPEGTSLMMGGLHPRYSLRSTTLTVFLEDYSAPNCMEVAC
jgi:hypothetical protein